MATLDRTQAFTSQANVAYEWAGSQPSHLQLAETSYKLQPWGEETTACFGPEVGYTVVRS